MIYASICDGIGAVHCAWQPLGWKCEWVSEIEPFPSAVVEHHWKFKNHGDFTQINRPGGPWAQPVQLLVGGTPCQSFSVAGLRGGMDDERGQLSLEFLKLALRLRPRWLVWENVPGVLSSNGGRDFGSFVRGLEECGYGWAYRILDAQYAGVPQRRRRVFVVGYLGDWRRAAAVLFERHGLQGHPAPRRETGQDIAGTIGARVNGGGGLGTDLLSEADRIKNGHRKNRFVSGLPISVSGSVSAKWAKGTGGPSGDECQNLVGCLQANGKAAGSATQQDAESERAICENENAGPDGAGYRADGQAYTLEARTVPQAVAFDTTQITSKANRSNPENVCPSMGNGIGAVRRLTPRECERLQGLPHDYTLVTYRNKPAADGPRYCAIGNSMAVPVMRWIGERIEMVEKL